MIVKKHITQDKKLVLAVCDNDLLGKRFSDNKIVLDLSGDFYKGEDLDEESVAALMKQAFIINMAGEKCVALAMDKGIIDRKNISFINNVPYAQSLIISE